MSYLLRHGAAECNVLMDKRGFVVMEDLITWLNQTHPFQVTVEDIHDIVQTCRKQRFTLVTIDKQQYVCANQGHSMHEVRVAMELIARPDEIPVAVHGTYHDAWRIIREMGLSRMSRQHIHLAAGLAGDQTVVSGMREHCQVLVYVDTAKAMADGITFYRLANGVILTEGIAGVLPTRYFLSVVDARTIKALEFVSN